MLCILHYIKLVLLDKVLILLLIVVMINTHGKNVKISIILEDKRNYNRLKTPKEMHRFIVNRH